MSLIPLRFLKSLWSRPYPTTNSVNALSTDGEQDKAHPMAQGDGNSNDERAQVEAEEPPSLTTSIDGLEASTSASPPNVVKTHLDDPLTDDHDVSGPLDEEMLEADDEHGQNHGSHPPTTPSPTFCHMDSTNERRGRREAHDGSKQDLSLERNYKEKVLEVSSDEDDEAGDGTPNSQLLDERRKLIQKNQRVCRLRPARFLSQNDHASEIIIEESTNNEPLPDGYLYPSRGIQYINPSLRLTGSCGAEEGLHKLTCEHWVSTPVPQPCGSNCHTPSISTEAFRCSKCCDTVQGILGTTIDSVEREKFEQARTGYHDFCIALAVEYVCKHSSVEGGLAEAVMHTLDADGRPCAPSAGPTDYDTSVERKMQQVRKRKQSVAGVTSPQHEKRNHCDDDDERDDAMSPTHARKKHKIRVCKDTSPDVVARGKRIAVSTSDDDEDKHGMRERTEKRATPVKVLHGGATRSPHFARMRRV